MPFLAHQRRLKIAQQVQDHGSVRVAELMRTFHVTDTSIRRDLEILESQGRLRRIHGGAVATARSQAPQSFQAKTREHPEFKARIGAAAAALVHVNESILLDSGTTVLEVALHLPKNLNGPTPLTVVTNSLPVVSELQAWSTIHLNLLGGILLPEYQATVGPQTIANLRRIQVDKAFVGCDGLTLSHGLTTPHMLIAEVGRVMAEVAHEVIAVADSSKLGRVGFTPIVPLNAVHKLITDSGAPAQLLDEIRAAGIEVIVI
jgi:DeoR/GlpR family transcriptional regulator of sugar metabolism